MARAFELFLVRLRLAYVLGRRVDPALVRSGVACIVGCKRLRSPCYGRINDGPAAGVWTTRAAGPSDGGRAARFPDRHRAPSSFIKRLLRLRVLKRAWATCPHRAHDGLHDHRTYGNLESPCNRSTSSSRCGSTLVRTSSRCLQHVPLGSGPSGTNIGSRPARSR